MVAHIDEILNSLAANAKIKEPSILCTYETGKGEGFMGIVKMFEITDKPQQNDEKSSRKLHLIVKQAPLADEIKNRLPVREIFLTEILFYNKIGPTMKQFQLDEQVDCFHGFVDKLYSDMTARKEMLVIENLKPAGYDVLDRTVPMQHDHMKLAFETCAKFHALSFAMKHKKPQLFKELTGLMYDNIYTMLYKKMGFDNFMPMHAQNMKHLFEGTDAYSIYCDFVERIAEEFHKTDIADEYSVILHGDTWCNNILYKNDAESKPTSVILIDFQLSRVLSPVIDLSYLFYGCADVKLLPNLKVYLKAYHDTLAKSLKMFNLDVEKVYSFDTLMAHWKSYGKFGFIISYLMRIIMLSAPEESADLSEAAKKDGDIMMAFMYKMKREDEYNATMKAIVHHFIEEKFIYS